MQTSNAGNIINSSNLRSQRRMPEKKETIGGGYMTEAAAGQKQKSNRIASGSPRKAA